MCVTGEVARMFLFLKFQKRLNSNLVKRSLDIRQIIQDRISSAISLAFGPKIAKSTRVSVSAIANEDYGHYQCVSAMPLAKELKMKPHDVAMRIFENLETKDLIESTEVAGPGFMNLRCHDHLTEFCHQLF
jgi:arginyl-tRNA synthetase